MRGCRFAQPDGGRSSPHFSHNIYCGARFNALLFVEQAVRFQCRRNGSSAHLDTSIPT